MVVVKERKLYKIGQLTKLLGITSRTIRYYDQMGVLPHVKRSTGGMRLFDDEDLNIIRNVRQLQDEEGLTLEQIKERIYGSRLNQKIAIVVTDSTASIPEELMSLFEIAIVPVTLETSSGRFDPHTQSLNEFWKSATDAPYISAPSVDTFKATYDLYASKGYKCIFSIHSSSQFSKTIENASIAAELVKETIQVNIYDSKSIASALGLLICQVAETISHGDPLEQIHRFVLKQRPMSYLICASGAIANLAPNTNNPHPALTQMFGFKPVYTINNVSGELEIQTCCKTSAEVADFMLDKLAIEVAIRGKYVNSIMITHLNMETVAQSLLESIETLHPTTRTFIQAADPSFSILVGTEAVLISVA